MKNEEIKILSELPQEFRKFKISQIEGGASKKILYRINEGSNSFIVISFIKDKSEYINYVKIYNYLKDFNISVPKIISKNDNLFFIICEDFGNLRFDKILKQYSIKKLLKLAVDTLIYLENSTKVNNKIKLKKYKFETFQTEIKELSDFYLPYIKIKNIELNYEFFEIWSKSFKNISFEFDSFVHKDFNLNNLIFLPSLKKHMQCGILDFQNAFLGESCWDLFSLLEDSRILFLDEYNEDFIQYYYQKTNIKIPFAEFKLKYYFLNCARQTRLLGRWVKLAETLNQPEYLKYIPITKKRLKKSINFLENKEIINFYYKYIL